MTDTANHPPEPIVRCEACGDPDHICECHGGPVLLVDHREADWPTICPGCQRRMSDREAKEQGMCNDCQQGAAS